MVLCMLLAVALMGWMAQPLAQLTFKARQLLRTSARQQPAQDVHWPRAGGEVGELVRVFQGLVQQGSLQQSRKDTVVGQFQAVLDSAPVGIVITRHGMLEVVSHQACVMLGYSAQELQGRPARILYASDADYAQVGDRVRAEVAAHGAFDGDVCFLRKDGTPCLLYTSPSPRDQRGSRMPSSA